MGLASGGGSRGGGYRGGSGFAMGYILGRGGGGDVGMATALVAAGAVVIITGVGVAGIIIDSKETKVQKAELNQTIAATMNYKSADVTYFDWLTNNDNEYIFKFTGNAMNMNDEKIDFFSCAYSVSEQQYYEVILFFHTLTLG